MKKETLKKANELNNAIIKKEAIILELEHDLKCIKLRSSRELVLEDTIEYYPEGNFSLRKRKIKIPMKDEYVRKAINDILYKERNLLKKYELELSKL